MFGPRITPSGSAPVRSARARRHSATMRSGAPAGRERSAGVAEPGPVGIGDGVDDRRGHLGTGRAVEVGVAVGQGRVSRPHAPDIEAHGLKTLSRMRLAGPGWGLTAEPRPDRVPTREAGSATDVAAAARRAGRGPQLRRAAPARRPARVRVGGPVVLAERPGQVPACRCHSAQAAPAIAPTVTSVPRYRWCGRSQDGGSRVRRRGPSRRTPDVLGAGARPAARPARPRSAGPACGRAVRGQRGGQQPAAGWPARRRGTRGSRRPRTAGGRPGRPHAIPSTASRAATSRRVNWAASSPDDGHARRPARCAGPGRLSVAPCDCPGNRTRPRPAQPPARARSQPRRARVRTDPPLARLACRGDPATAHEPPVSRCYFPG